MLYPSRTPVSELRRATLRDSILRRRMALIPSARRGPEVILGICRELILALRFLLFALRSLVGQPSVVVCFLLWPLESCRVSRGIRTQAGFWLDECMRRALSSFAPLLSLLGDRQVTSGARGHFNFSVSLAFSCALVARLLFQPMH